MFSLSDLREKSTTCQSLVIWSKKFEYIFGKFIFYRFYRSTVKKSELCEEIALFVEGGASFSSDLVNYRTWL